MAAGPSMDPARFLEEQLAAASPELLRGLLKTVVDALMSADADAARGERPVATATGCGTGTPGWAASSWRSRDAP
jgi:hypothetical protein